MRCRLLILIVSLTCTGMAAADPPKWTKASCCPNLGCCPDDYCKKPCPSICPVPCCGGPCDYCRKPFPYIAEVGRCGGPNDYCRKPMPCLLCPPTSPYLQCGTSDTGCCSKR